MIVLGLDPSFSAYGWAVHESTAVGRERILASGHEATLSTTVSVVRFMHFQALVRKLIEKYDPQTIGIESPAFHAGPFQSIHYGLMIFSMIPIFEFRKDCVLYDPTTLKFLVKEDPTNKKKVSKQDIQRKVKLDTKCPIALNDNEADAYMIAKYSGRFMHLMRGDIKPEDLTGSEKRVFIERTKRVKRMSVRKTVKVAHAFKENSRFFQFSKIPPGEVSLPEKSMISQDILDFLEAAS